MPCELYSKFGDFDHVGKPINKETKSNLELRNRIMFSPYHKRRSKKYLMNSGGLGNQLFIFAAAHYILKQFPQNNVVIVHKKQNRSDRGQREFWLPHFEGICNHSISYKESIFLPLILKKLDQVSTIFPRLSAKINNLVGYKKSLDPYEICLLDKSHSWVVVRGFFQNSELVLAVESELKVELFALRDEVFSSMRDNGGKLEEVDGSIAIHVRRGDFLENKEEIGVLDLEYYESAINESIGVLFVASDDPRLELGAYKNCQLKFLDPEKVSPLETFFMIGKARKLYAANSTFSWWAALVCIWDGGEGHIPSPFYKRVDAPKLRHPKMILEASVYE
jgi:hypothetical protein